MVLFFPFSSRCIAAERDREIIRALGGAVMPAAVMGSPSPDQVREACKADENNCKDGILKAAVNAIIG
jgi:hypothetical protein